MNEDTKSPATVTLAPAASPAPVQAAPAVDVVPPPVSSESNETVSDAPTTTSQPSSRPQPKTPTIPVAAIIVAIFACIVLCGLAYLAYAKG